MPDPREAVTSHGHLRRYVLANERVVVATRRHWARLLEPIASTVAAFLLVGVALQAAGPELRGALEWLWIAWLVVAARLVWRWLEWHQEWFVATDKRLLLLYGLVVHKVAMMPLVKVTDMGYSRTPLGQVLGYGRFVLESAGQEQALRQIDWVPHPDATYRKLCATMFQPMGGQAPAQQPGHRPPAVVPGARGSRPTTQPIPVVPAEPQPAQTATPPGGYDLPSTGERPPRTSWAPIGRQPSPGTPSENQPPTSSGGGTTVPKPFL